MRKENRTLKQILAKLLVFALVFQLAVPVGAAPVAEEVSVADIVEEMAQETEPVETVEETEAVAVEAEFVQEEAKNGLPEASAEEIGAEGEGEELVFSIDKDGIIYRCDGVAGEKLVIPDEVNGVKVTGIGNGSPFQKLQYKQTVKEVVLPDGIQKLNGNAFESFSVLEKINFPESLTEIGLYAFKGTAITEAYLPNVTTIGWNAFQNCESLKKVTFGNAIKTIGGDSFNGCSSLESVDIPSGSDVAVNTRAFENCTSLKEVQVSGNSIEIGDSVFTNVPAERVDISGSKIIIKGKAFNGISACDMSISAPSIKLGKNSLAGFKVNSLRLNGHLEEYQIGGITESIFGMEDNTIDTFENISNVYYIDAAGLTSACGTCNKVFSVMTGLKPGAKVVFTGDLTNLEKNAGSHGGANVAEFAFEDEKAAAEFGYQIINNVLYKENGTGLTPIWAPQGMELEDGWLHLPEQVTAFSEVFYGINNVNNTKVTKLVLPKSMTTIEGVVVNNKADVTIRLPEDGDTKYSVNSIFAKINYDYDATLVLPSSLENYTINSNAIEGIDHLVIPAGMTEFPQNVAVWLRSVLETIEVEEGNTAFKVVDGAVYSADGKTLYWWPISAINKTVTITIPEGVETISKYAFAPAGNSSNKNTATIILPSTLKEIEENAIYNEEYYLMRVVANKCSDDVKVGNIIKDVHYLYVKDAETSPFVKKWENENNKVSYIISGGIVKINPQVLFETEAGEFEKGSVGSYRINLSKVDGSTVTSVNNDCMYMTDGSVEMLLPNDGTYQLEFIPARGDVYLPKTVENVELTVVSPENMAENVKDIEVSLDRIPVLRVNADKGVLGYVFDADGNYLSDLSERDFGLISKGLPAGNYSVLLHKSSHKLMKQNKLSDYEVLGLVNGTDYVVEAFEIVAYEESVDDVTIDASDFASIAEKDGLLKVDACSYTASATDARIGYTNLDIVYAIDSEKWDASAEAVTILVTLPDGASYINNSAFYVPQAGADREACTAEVSGSFVRFTLDKDSLEGRIRFSVTTEEDAEGVSCAYVEGAAKDFIGAVEFLKKELTVNAPDEFSKDDKIRVSGLAPAGKTVQLFVGDVKVGEAVANDRGAWGANIEIENDKIGETYVVTGRIQQGSNVATAYDETLCVEKAIKVTSISYEYYHNVPSKVVKSEVDMNTLVGKRAIETTISKCFVPFLVYVDVENGENIEELFLSYDDGQGRRDLAFYTAPTADGRLWIDLDVKVEGLPNELSLIAKVKDGDEVKEIDICDFVIQWIIDPSGYIYEAVPENRVEGATVTIYYQDSSTRSVKWNAQEFGQVNPVTTDRNGSYAWFVPKGKWKVVVKKEGYTTAESSWLPVPPPQLDVNLELVSTMQPKVAGVDLAKDKMVVRFDNYVLADDITTESVVLKDSKDVAVEIASVEAVDAKQRNSKSIAKEFVVTFASSLAEGTYAATFAAGIKSYASVAMSEAQTVGDLTVAGIVKDITTPEFFVTKAGKDCTFEVTVVSDEDVNGRILTATSADESKIKVVSTTAANAEGKATITLNGPAMTVTEITLGVENSSFTKTVSVMVIENDAVFDKMFEENGFEKPQIPSKNEGGEVPSEPEKPSKPEKKDPVDLAKATVATIANQVYTGSALTPAVTVTVDGKTLVKDTDYTVAYANNTDAGTAQVTITGKGNYTGTKTVTFTIDKAASKLKASKATYKKAYGAKAFTVKVTGAEGTVSYKSSSTKVAKVSKSGKVTIKNTGRAVITASVKESKNYKAGSVKIVIEVSPKKAAIKTLASKKAKQLTVTWKKDKKATGYEVTYSTSKKFKKSQTKKVLVKKNKTTKTTIKKLKKGKTYYVKVRAYKEVKVNGKKVKIYSPYSKVLKKKVK